MEATLLETMTQDSPKGLIVPIGADSTGTNFSLDLGKTESLLISYPKWMAVDTTIIRKILDSTQTNNKPQECRLIVVDLCEAGLKSYDGSDYLLTPVIEVTERLICAHQWTLKEIDKRMELFKEYGVKSIEQYNQVAGFTAMEYILIVDVDISEAMMIAPSAIYDLMSNIMVNARKTGFIMIATTKHPRDLMSKLFKSIISYKGNDEIGIVNYQSEDNEESQKIKLDIA
jgi:S-DNA-T family DNA segregation ATPase FtsK/SpoIIIE